MFSLDTLPDLLFFFFSRYMAVFSMLTALIYVSIAYARTSKFAAVRDGLTYIAAIAVLGVVLLFIPKENYFFIWQMVLWFTFTMLLVLEMLWFAYLLVSLMDLAKIAAHRHANQNSSRIKDH